LGVRLDPRTSFTLFAGGFLYRVQGVGLVNLPGEMAVILGTTTIQQVYDTRHRGLSAGASLQRTLRVGSAGISYDVGARPGNGLLFPTKQETFAGNYSVGISRFSLGANAYYSRGKSISSIEGEVQNKAIIGSGSFRILGSLHATASVSQHWILAGTIPSRRYFGANIGLAYSPGSFPLWF
jgi:hypothetical protein